MSFINIHPTAYRRSLILHTHPKIRSIIIPNKYLVSFFVIFVSHGVTTFLCIDNFIHFHYGLEIFLDNDLLSIEDSRLLCVVTNKFERFSSKAN